MNFVHLGGDEILSNKTAQISMGGDFPYHYNAGMSVVGNEQVRSIGFETESKFEGGDELALIWDMDRSGVDHLYLGGQKGYDAMTGIPRQELVCRKLNPANSVNDPSSLLDFYPIPANTILVPVGRGTTISNGNITLQAPYFIVSSLDVAWSGNSKLIIDSIDLFKGNQRVGHYEGTVLQHIFEGFTDKDGHVSIPANTETRSGAFGGSAVDVENVNASEFNIEITLVITAHIKDMSGQWIPVRQSNTMIVE